MRSKVLWFLLTASLALNVFFVAGVIWPRLMGHPYPPHGRDPVAAAAEQFKLDDRQVAALEALRQRLAERRSESRGQRDGRSEEHTYELQSLMRISYAVFCLQQNKYLTSYMNKYSYASHTPITPHAPQRRTDEQ